MKIELTNGYAVNKDYYPRKVDKAVKRILFKNVKVIQEGIGEKATSKTEGFDFLSSEEANDFAMVEMIDELNINGEKKEVNADVLDEMSTKDYNKIKKAIDEIASPAEEAKKK